MNLKFWLGLLISSAFLYVAFRNVDVGLIFLSIKSASLPFVILGVVLTVIFYLIRALRWFHLLEPIKRIGLSSLFSSTPLVSYRVTDIHPWSFHGSVPALPSPLSYPGAPVL